jgi:hypothetical protein
MTSSAITGNTSGLATATTPGLYKAGQAPGSTAGTAIAAGFVGEMAGTLRSGTGGFTYSTRTTTAPTTSLSSVISLTLNKGVYLISVVSTCGASSSTYYSGGFYIGGTSVLASGDSLSSTTSSSAYGSISLQLPLIISSDSTVIDLRTILGGGTAVGPKHEMWAVRIA